MFFNSGDNTIQYNGLSSISATYIPLATYIVLQLSTSSMENKTRQKRCLESWKHGSHYI